MYVEFESFVIFHLYKLSSLTKCFISTCSKNSKEDNMTGATEVRVSVVKEAGRGEREEAKRT